jgi:hypothetical protein
LHIEIIRWIKKVTPYHSWCYCSVVRESLQVIYLAALHGPKNYIVTANQSSNLKEMAIILLCQLETMSSRVSTPE